MAVFRTDRNQKWNTAGDLIEDEEVVVDITAEYNESEFNKKLRAAQQSNIDFLFASRPEVLSGMTAQQILMIIVPQVRRLTIQMQATIKLLIKEDLLLDDTGT